MLLSAGSTTKAYSHVISGARTGPTVAWRRVLRGDQPFAVGLASCAVLSENGDKPLRQQALQRVYVFLKLGVVCTGTGRLRIYSPVSGKSVFQAFRAVTRGSRANLRATVAAKRTGRRMAVLR